MPPAAPYDGDTWVETVLGTIVAPLRAEHDSLAWFWFSRYVASPSEDAGDCDISRIPASFAVDEGRFRSLRLRYGVPPEDRKRFEHRALELLESSGSTVSDFRDYDIVGDLGGDRFLGEERSDGRRDRRAEVVLNALWAICSLTVDCLRGPDDHGRYRFEKNDHRQNPHSSSFESMHHLFCNITNVPTAVLVIDGRIGTHWAPPAPNGTAYEVPIRF